MGEWVAREGGHLDGCFYDSIASLYDLHTMEVNIWRTLLPLKKMYQILTLGAAGNISLDNYDNIVVVVVVVDCVGIMEMLTIVDDVHN